ncbi:LysE/ArgO family amino acid transporter [Microbacterium sp. NPDC057659]|uniref:LysE/ArgO family amino acid transporter n=1 Tax=Microbacterium sp. NPDC057659 TaxID=3346198 RepID=UPI00366C6C95
MLTLLSGLGLMYSLIIAVGAQNVFVLRQGMRREHVLPVVLICAASDALLVLAGTAGLGYLVNSAPWLIVVARWAGGISLVAYGIFAARRAWAATGETLVADTEADAAGMASGDGGVRTATRLAPVILATLAFTWLNPNVYLDTVLLIGGIAATHGDQRWLFAAGAIVGSITWFFALGYGARYLGRWLRTPRAWRILDTAIAVLLVTMGIALVVPVFTG